MPFEAPVTNIFFLLGISFNIKYHNIYILTMTSNTKKRIQTKKISQTKKDVSFFMSYFEIYGGKCMDLLNNKK